MDQYNRLLDIFNLENSSKDKKNDLLKQLSQEPMSHEKKLQYLQQQQHQHQNRQLSGSRQSVVSIYTTTSNLPISGIDGIIGSAHDLRIQNDYDDDLQTYSTATVNRVQQTNQENNGRRQSDEHIDNRSKTNNLINSSSIMTSDPNLYQSNNFCLDLITY
jgi:hypothetical protein